MKFNFGTNKESDKKILIVDDEPQSVLVLKKILESYQFQLIVAVNGVEAVKKFEVKKPDLVIMDLYMPEMDGFEASKKIKKMAADVPIIVVSSTNIEEEDLKKDIGIDYFLAKPLNIQKFRDFIHMLLLA